MLLPSSLLIRIQWMPEINRYAHGKPVILLGLKSDLRTDPDALARLSSRRMTPVSFNQGSDTTVLVSE